MCASLFSGFCVGVQLGCSTLPQFKMPSLGNGGTRVCGMDQKGSETVNVSLQEDILEGLSAE